MNVIVAKCHWNGISVNVAVFEIRKRHKKNPEIPINIDWQISG